MRRRFTYLRTAGGFAYLASVLDVYSQMIVGWQIASHHRASLVTDALEMAICVRDTALDLLALTDGRVAGCSGSVRRAPLKPGNGDPANRTPF